VVRVVLLELDTLEPHDMHRVEAGLGIGGSAVDTDGKATRTARVVGIAISITANTAGTAAGEQA
jgi:hypothetical protein